MHTSVLCPCRPQELLSCPERVQGACGRVPCTLPTCRSRTPCCSLPPAGPLGPRRKAGEHFAVRTVPSTIACLAACLLESTTACLHRCYPAGYRPSVCVLLLSLTTKYNLHGSYCLTSCPPNACICGAIRQRNDVELASGQVWVWLLIK